MTEDNDEDEEYLFTCKDCGSHELYVEHFYDLWSGPHWSSYVETGTLDDDHRVEEWEEPEEYDSGYDENYAEAEDEEAEDGAEDEEAQVDEDSVEFYVRCAGCNREIEFGWSHPDRGGRIWPAECADFNPWKSWPEPRYEEEWRKKNWLRPDGDVLKRTEAIDK